MKIATRTIRNLLRRRPELRERFRVITTDGYTEFTHPEGVNHYYDPEKHGWRVDSFDGDDDGSKVINGRTWHVNTNSWTLDVRVSVDGVPTDGSPDCQFKHYDVWELIDLGLWTLPDFAAHLKQAEAELVLFDAETADRPRQRAILERAIERRRKLIS